MAVQHRAGHICVLALAPAQDRVPLPAAASTQSSVPQPAARWQLHPLGIWGIPNADFPKMYRFQGGGDIHPEISKCFTEF